MGMRIRLLMFALRCFILLRVPVGTKVQQYFGVVCRHCLRVVRAPRCQMKTDQPISISDETASRFIVRFGTESGKG